MAMGCWVMGQGEMGGTLGLVGSGRDLPKALGRDELLQSSSTGLGWSVKWIKESQLYNNNNNKTILS